jgi:hypothetical protein
VLTVSPGDELYVNVDLDALLGGLSLEKQAFTHTDVATFGVAEAVSDRMIQSIAVEVRE